MNAPRNVVKHVGKILSIDLHTFGDASGKGVAAAVYAVVEQPSGTNRGLVTAKSRLAKKGLTIPRLELVAGHMAANLVQNVKEVLKGFPVRSVYGWLDSTVALHWIRGNGEYKQFVGNRVRKIQEKEINWRHVPTEENPADVGSRGGDVSRLTALWWQGPSWLAKPQDWPPDLVTTSTQESKAEEVKQTRELFALAVEKTENNDAFDALLEKYELWRVLRVGAWIWRFLHNIRTVRKQRIVGPLTTEEIQKQTTFWIKRSQQQAKSSQKFEEDRLQLNVQGNQEGILECRGRIQGHYLIFQPDSSPFTHHDQSTRAILGTAFKGTRKTSSQGVFRLQAFSGPWHWKRRLLDSYQLTAQRKHPIRGYCNNTANHTFKRLLNRHLISIKCLEGTNETEYIMSLAARANEIQHRA